MNSPFVYMSDALGKSREANRCTIHDESHRRIRLSGSGRDVEKVWWTNKTLHTILKNISLHGDIRNIIESIQNSTFKSVSDNFGKQFSESTKPHTESSSQPQNAPFCRAQYRKNAKTNTEVTKLHPTPP